VREALDVENFLSCFEFFNQQFVAWTQGVMSMEGKTVRTSFDARKGLKGPHIVSAWTPGCKGVLAQEKVTDKEGLSQWRRWGARASSVGKFWIKQQTTVCP
jgi:hypothetical protein